MKLALVLVLCACADDGGPRITSVMPPAAPHGGTVWVHGIDLCEGRPSCHGLGGNVQLGLGSPSYQAPVVDATPEMWRFQVPDFVPIGETDVLLTLDGRSSNALPFEVIQ